MLSAALKTLAFVLLFVFGFVLAFGSEEIMVKCGCVLSSGDTNPFNCPDWPLGVITFTNYSIGMIASIFGFFGTIGYTIVFLRRTYNSAWDAIVK